MKPIKAFTLGVSVTVLLSLLVVSTFWVGNAYASTGCFSDTNGHWAETFICWMKDNGISSGIGGGNYGPEQYVTRAQMAVFMQKQAEVPPSTGLITISEGFGNWKPFISSDPLNFYYLSGRTMVIRSSPGYNFISLHPSIPTMFYGKNLQLVGIEFCYVASPAVHMDYFEINTPLHTTGAGEQTYVYGDWTSRTDTACRYYVLPTPVNLTVENTVNIYAGLYWETADAAFEAGRTTFVLQPTSTTAVGPAMLSGEVTPLQEGAAGHDGASTNSP